MGNRTRIAGMTVLKVEEITHPNLNIKLNTTSFPITSSTSLNRDLLQNFLFDKGKDNFNNAPNMLIIEDCRERNFQETAFLNSPNYVFNHTLNHYSSRFHSRPVKFNEGSQGSRQGWTKERCDELYEEVQNAGQSKQHSKLEKSESIQRKTSTEINNVARSVNTTENTGKSSEIINDSERDITNNKQDLQDNINGIPGKSLSEKLSFDESSVLPMRSLIMATSSSKTTCQLVQDLKDWKFSKSKLLELPIDEEKNNYLRRNNRGCIFSVVMPTQLKSPTLVAFSKDVLINVLNMDPNITKTQDFADFIAGNTILENSVPLAHRYGGHQFGYWAMQLGDGRAILLGEFTNSAGERWELQLKGSGRTPYSRDGDGRAVLRSSIREFLCSEAMHYLGIPTSRAGAIIVSEERAYRDPMYDGNPVMEKTAVVLRIAPTWFRFGSFELPMKTNEEDLLQKLFDFILKEHFPDIDPSSEDRVLTFLSQVARLTSDLVVAWQAVGFTHGVLNTDNMSVLGVTIDYGPFGFLEAYDPEYIPNASDHEGRYCYMRQPSIIMYNIMKLTEALFPLMSETQKKQTSGLLQAEANYLTDSLVNTFSKKLGLQQSDKALVEMFSEMLEETKADFTMSYRDLSEIEVGHLDSPCPGKFWALATLAQHKMYPKFVSEYKDKLKEAGITDEERRKQMCQTNPRYVLRNWMAQMAINEAEEDNFVEVERLLRILSSPFERQEEAEQMGFAKPPPGWASKLRLSCSS